MSHGGTPPSRGNFILLYIIVYKRELGVLKFITIHVSLLLFKCGFLLRFKICSAEVCKGCYNKLLCFLL